MGRLGWVPTAHPFSVGGPLADRSIPQLLRGPSDVAIVGNVNFPPSHGTHGLPLRAPSHQKTLRRMPAHGNPSPSYPLPQLPPLRIPILGTCRIPPPLPTYIPVYTCIPILYNHRYIYTINACGSWCSEPSIQIKCE